MNSRSFWKSFAAGLVASVVCQSAASQSATAIALRDGTVYFEQPPRLLEAVTTQNTAYVWGATYYFTVRLPENAGEPLQQVTINQHDGIEYVRFKLEDTEAFEGTYRQKGAELNLAEVKSDRQTRSVAIAFSPPVPPGTTITIALYPRRNPESSGIYQFGVTAFPPGEKSHGQFLGFGRLHFYRYGDRAW